MHTWRVSWLFKSSKKGPTNCFLVILPTTVNSVLGCYETSSSNSQTDPFLSYSHVSISAKMWRKEKGRIYIGKATTKPPLYPNRPKNCPNSTQPPYLFFRRNRHSGWNSPSPHGWPASQRCISSLLSSISVCLSWSSWEYLAVAKDMLCPLTFTWKFSISRFHSTTNAKLPLHDEESHHRYVLPPSGRTNRRRNMASSPFSTPCAHPSRRLFPRIHIRPKKVCSLSTCIEILHFHMLPGGADTNYKLAANNWEREKEKERIITQNKIRWWRFILWPISRSILKV